MIFEIYKISTGMDSPHPNAVEKTGWRFHKKKMGEKVPKQFAQNFWLGGRNHKIENNIWEKEYEMDYWEIDLDITTIDELYEFMATQQHPIILSKSSFIGIDKRLEIYDEYRE